MKKLLALADSPDAAWVLILVIVTGLATFILVNN
jgi:hypothetical protein